MSCDESSEARFAAYVEALTGVMGHADRATLLRHYCTGLLMPAARKSVELTAAKNPPARAAPQHQSLLHFVGQAPWSDAAVLTKVRDLVLPTLEGTGPIEAYHGSVWWRVGWACDSRLRDERSALNGWDRATGRDRRDGHGATPAGPA